MIFNNAFPDETGNRTQSPASECQTNNSRLPAPLPRWTLLVSRVVPGVYILGPESIKSPRKKNMEACVSPHVSQARERSWPIDGLVLAFPKVWSCSDGGMYIHLEGLIMRINRATSKELSHEHEIKDGCV